MCLCRFCQGYFFLYMSRNWSLSQATFHYQTLRTTPRMKSLLGSKYVPREVQIFFLVSVRYQFQFPACFLIYPYQLPSHKFCSLPCVAIYFNWMTPLMQQGYKKPLTEKDVWKLDSWDQTETLSKKFVSKFSFSFFIIQLSIYAKHKMSIFVTSQIFWFYRFQKCWEEEAHRSEPWLLRALNRSLGGRYTI